VKSCRTRTRSFIIFAASIFIAPFASGEEVSLGNKQAPVTIIEYGSLTCGNCLAFHKHVYPKLKKQYIDTGAVRFIYRHFPTGGSAVHGARAANCSSDKYYEMIDKLFSSAGSWFRAENKEAIFIKYATTLGLDSDTFAACISNKNNLDNILLQQKTAKNELNISVTPTFLINGKMVRGKRTFLEMKELISIATPNTNPN